MSERVANNKPPRYWKYRGGFCYVPGCEKNMAYIMTNADFHHEANKHRSHFTADFPLGICEDHSVNYILVDGDIG